MTRHIYRVAIRLGVLAIMIGLAGLLGVGAGATTTTGTYEFWNLDGCHYTWAGPAETWRKGDCGRADFVAWGQGSAQNQLYHWDGQEWVFQGIYSQGTMDTPNGIFILPFISDGKDHLFVYDYADKQWYHIRMIKQSVVAVPNPTLPPPELETTSGWHPITELENPKLGTMVREWEAIQDDIVRS